MKRFIAPAVAALVLSLAPAVVAQEGRTPGEPREPGTGRTAGAPGEPGTPGTGRTAGAPREAGTPRTGGESPRSLPTTGFAGDLAVDGAALLGAGLVLMRTRRRITS